MINILPPELKQQLRYAERNSALGRWLGGITLATILVFSLVTTGIWYARRQLVNLRANLASQQLAEAAFKNTETNVKTLQSSLVAIDKLLSEQTAYSKLLADLAALLPSNTYINHIALTGDATKPVEMLATVDSVDRAAQLRTALNNSPRIKSADIQNIAANEAGPGYAVSIVIAFETEGAR